MHSNSISFDMFLARTSRTSCGIFGLKLLWLTSNNSGCNSNCSSAPLKYLGKKASRTKNENIIAICIWKWQQRIVEITFDRFVEMFQNPSHNKPLFKICKSSLEKCVWFKNVTLWMMTTKQTHLTHVTWTTESFRLMDWRTFVPSARNSPFGNTFFQRFL